MDISFSQVSLIRLVKDFLPCFLHLILVAAILSSVSLQLITLNHLALASLLLCGLSCMTLSHLRTQIRWADSEISICRSLLAPLLPIGTCGGSPGLLVISSSGGPIKVLHPRITPRFMSKGGQELCFMTQGRGGVTQKSLKKFTFLCDGRASPLIWRGCTLRHIPAHSPVHFPTLCHFPSLCAHLFSMYCCPLLPSLANAP